VREDEATAMKYVPRHMDDVRNVLGGIEDDVAVGLSGVTLSGVHTVADVRALSVWPGLGLVVEHRPVVVSARI
jgi:hypothetical protein